MKLQKERIEHKRDCGGKLFLWKIKYLIEFSITNHNIIKMKNEKVELQLEIFKVWRYLVKIQVPKTKKIKIKLKIVDCIFIGHAIYSKTYYFLVHKSKNSDIHVNMIIELYNIEFIESIYP